MIIHRASQDSGNIKNNIIKKQKEKETLSPQVGKDVVSISFPGENCDPPSFVPQKRQNQAGKKKIGNFIDAAVKGNYPQFDDEPLQKTQQIASLHGDGRVKAELTSRECKMLLLPENFSNSEKGMLKFWKMVKNVAEEQGLSVKDGDEQKLGEPRYIAYLDTPHFSLNKLGYILRRRQNKEIEPGKGKKYELTLKYRNADMNTVAAKDISLGKDYEGKSKFENDTVSGKDSIKSMYSKSAKTNLKEKIGNDLEDYADVFPSLEKLGLPLDTELGFVNNRKMEEYSIDLGEITFPDGVTAKAGISVWYNQGKEKPVIGEFSLAYGIEGKSNTSVHSEPFMKALQKSSGKWIADGITKTELIYGKRGE